MVALVVVVMVEVVVVVEDVVELPCWLMQGDSAGSRASLRVWWRVAPVMVEEEVVAVVEEARRWSMDLLKISMLLLLSMCALYGTCASAVDVDGEAVVAVDES